MRKKTQKKNCISGPLGNVKTYLDAKFQLIWPSNEARASSDHFFGIKCDICVWSHYTLLNLCKNLATRGPFGPSLCSVLIIFEHFLCWYQPIEEGKVKTVDKQYSPSMFYFKIFKGGGRGLPPPHTLGRSSGVLGWRNKF